MAWNYYKTHTMTGSSDGAKTNFPIRLKVYAGAGSDSADTCYLNNQCSHWPNDIKFTNSAGNVDWDFFLESSDVSSAQFTIEVPSMAQSTNFDMRIYYGNSAQASSLSNGANTFPLLFDDFNNSSFDGTKWETFGTAPTVTETTNLQIVYNGGNGGVQSKVDFGPYSVGAVRRLKTSSNTTQVQGDFSDGKCCQVRFTSTDKQVTYWDYRDSSTSYTLSNIDKTVYHTTRVEWVTSTVARFWLDDGNAHTLANNVPDVAERFRLAYLYGAQTVNVDYAYVYQTTLNPPTHGAWSGMGGLSELSGTLNLAASGDGAMSITATGGGGGGGGEVLPNGLHVYIGGAEYSVKYDTLEFEKTMSRGAGTGSFTVIDTANNYEFRSRTMVQVLRNAEIVFLGWIDSIEEEPVTPSGVKFHHITCVGTQYITDKYKHFEVMCDAGASAAYQIRAIGSWLQFMGDNINYDSTTIPYHTDEARCENMDTTFDTLSDALDYFCKLDGRVWWIDTLFRLWAIRMTDGAGTALITENDMLKGTAKLRRAEPEYCTAVMISGVGTTRILKGGTDGESAPGNGARRTFKFSEPIDEIVHLYENNTLVDPANIATKPNDGSAEKAAAWYYWSQGDASIEQDTDRPLLNTDQNLRCIYYTVRDLDAWYQSDVERVNLAIRDGCSGVNFYTETNDNRFDYYSAIEYAKSIIAQRSAGTQQMTMTFSTRTTPIRVGMTIYVTSSKFGLSVEPFVVTRVRERGNQFDWTWEVEASNKYYSGDWSKYLS